MAKRWPKSLAVSLEMPGIRIWSCICLVQSMRIACRSSLQPVSIPWACKTQSLSDLLRDPKRLRCISVWRHIERKRPGIKRRSKFTVTVWNGRVSLWIPATSLTTAKPRRHATKAVHTFGKWAIHLGLQIFPNHPHKTMLNPWEQDPWPLGIVSLQERIASWEAWSPINECSSPALLVAFGLSINWLLILQQVDSCQSLHRWLLLIPRVSTLWLVPHQQLAACASPIRRTRQQLYPCSAELKEAIQSPSRCLRVGAALPGSLMPWLVSQCLWRSLLANSKKRIRQIHGWCDCLAWDLWSSQSIVAFPRFQQVRTSSETSFGASHAFGASWRIYSKGWWTPWFGSSLVQLGAPVASLSLQLFGSLCARRSELACSWCVLCWVVVHMQLLSSTRKTGIQTAYLGKTRREALRATMTTLTMNDWSVPSDFNVLCSSIVSYESLSNSKATSICILPPVEEKNGARACPNFVIHGLHLSRGCQ